MFGNNPFGLRHSQSFHWLGELSCNSSLCCFATFDFGLRAGILNLLHIMRRFDVYFLSDILFYYRNHNSSPSFLARILRDSNFSIESYIQPFSSQFYLLCTYLCLIETNTLVSVRELQYIVFKFCIL